MTVITAWPARTDRQQSTCINCHESVYRSQPADQPEPTWLHLSTNTNQCPDHAQPRSLN